MKRTPLLTIGLPVYNSERYLEQSLDSLLNQSFGEFRLIISDNASTDRTGEICQDYARRDQRIDYFRNSTNIGLSPNFNRVFELSDSPYFKWATADDYWAPSMLEKALAIMESDTQVALCYPKTILVDADGNNPRPYEDNLHLISDNPRERFTQLLEQIHLSHQHLGVSRASMIRRTRMLGKHVGSDINFLAELALYGKFYEIPERLFFRRFHKLSSSWARTDRKHQEKRYHSSITSRIVLNDWRQYFEFFRAVHGAPIGIKNRLALYRYLTRRMRWDRGFLIRELKTKADSYWREN